MATEALPSKDLVSGTVYLLSCELQTGSEIFNGECDAMMNDLDTTSKQTSRSFVLVPIDFLYMTSYKLSIGPSIT